MEVKNRTIQMGSEGNAFMIDEYGTADDKIFHRYVVISREIYETFQKNPDSDKRFNAFLKQHDIDSEWRRVTPDDISSHPEWLQEADLENKQAASTEPSEASQDDTYKKVYDTLSEKETLMTDPFIMDVFNEAIRDDSDLTDWESVFPFFR